MSELKGPNTVVNIIRCINADEAKGQFERLIQRAVDAHRGDTFTVGLSGGSLPAILAEVLPHINTDWKKWKLFFCDERLVSFNDPESTFGAYRKEVIAKLPQISLNQFVTIDPSLKAEDAAFDYLSKMRHIFLRKTEGEFPRFDLLFLGMGPDGHTCSLFPGHSKLKETQQWVAYISDSPKPPPNRVTLTLPVLNNAKCCIFYVTGAAKAQVLREIIVDHKPLPAGLVRPSKGELYWIVDADAASLTPVDSLRRMSIT